MKGRSKPYCYKETINSVVFTKYLRKVISDLKSGPFKKRQFTLVMDSARYHTSAHTTQWLQKNNIKYVPQELWPANSPDLNPIEHLWEPIQTRVAARSPKTVLGLKRAASKVWNAVTKKEIASIINVPHRRYKAVIDSEGKQTKS